MVKILEVQDEALGHWKHPEEPWENPGGGKWKPPLAPLGKIQGGGEVRTPLAPVLSGEGVR